MKSSTSNIYMRTAQDSMSIQEYNMLNKYSRYNAHIRYIGIFQTEQASSNAISILSDYINNIHVKVHIFYYITDAIMYNAFIELSGELLCKCNKDHIVIQYVFLYVPEVKSLPDNSIVYLNNGVAGMSAHNEAVYIAHVSMLEDLKRNVEIVDRLRLSWHDCWGVFGRNVNCSTEKVDNYTELGLVTHGTITKDSSCIASHNNYTLLDDKMNVYTCPQDINKGIPIGRIDGKEVKFLSMSTAIKYRVVDLYTKQHCTHCAGIAYCHGLCAKVSRQLEEKNL